ncbi:MAG: ATP-dependent DNA helicase [Promethearchaeota archaeon]|nr:MAG: ATP-dependent DNA helicase [Candidatus Lokiarchaeota archaeon]
MDKINYLDFFPYEQFRQEQEKSTQQVELASKEKKITLLVAPNGTGKTIIALSALLPLVFEKDLKILYTCRTHSQNTRIIKELRKISNFLENSGQNHRLNGLSIRGRNEMCLNKTLLSLKLDPKESMAVCFDLRTNNNCSHYNNLLKKKDKTDKLTSLAPELLNQPIDAEDLLNFCSENKLCPYYLSKYLLEEIKVIICNYQWVLNPRIRENFLDFIGKELENCLVVIDECHNLIDVATELNSDRITPYLLRLCLRDLEMYRSPQQMQTFVRILMNHLETIKNSMRRNEKKLDPVIFITKMFTKMGKSSLREFKSFITDFLEFGTTLHQEKVDNGEIARDYIGSLANFFLKWIKCCNYKSYFFSYNLHQRKEKLSISLDIIALDPREISLPVLDKCYTCVNLSGTANPYVYANLIGITNASKTYKAMIVKSPFKKEHIKALIVDGVDTRRANRKPFMYQKMLSKIEEVIESTPGNVGIFCASYKILDALLRHGIDLIVKKYDKQLFIEEPGLSASGNAILVEDFKSLAKKPYNGAVLLGVCGGRNSEGEDYPGDTMNSVIIAGFPYHLPSPRMDAKIEYYDDVFNKQGWNFAYLYPAIQRANQASGRPIRKLEDKGSIVFLDARFKKKYRWISEWIRNEIEIVPDREGVIRTLLSNFWRKKQ